jgi:acyl-CoA dehydrogenase
MTSLQAPLTLVAMAEDIGARVAGPAADAVDLEARFPREAIAALADARLLGAFVPVELGGQGATIAELAAICRTLGRFCASTAMIFAMHQIEVVCLVRHGLSSSFFRNYLTGLARHQWLIASATSEIGVGGDLRRSRCALVREGARLQVTKQAPVISYGQEADAILLTARRAPDAAPGDQALVLLNKEDTQLVCTGEWDTLGMRGTRSLGFTLEATASAEAALPAPFADVARRTMVPTSHLLWASVWLGVAVDAVARARAFIRTEARRSPGVVPPGALRLAETVAALGTLQATVDAGLSRVAQSEADPDQRDDLGFAIQINNLKVEAARLAPAVVAQALGVCGISGYRRDSPYSVERHLRDIYSAALMISNDRVLAANAEALLVYKEH